MFIAKNNMNEISDFYKFYKNIRYSSVKGKTFIQEIGFQ